MPQRPSFPHFEIEIERRDEASIARVSGELDLAAALDFRARQHELALEEAEEVVLDLRGLTFMDSSGIRLIIELWTESRNAGFNFGILPGNGQVEGLLRTTGLDEKLPLISPEPAQAL